VTRLVVADDHPLVLRGIKGLFEASDFRIVQLCTDGVAAMEQIELGACDVAIIDVRMPGMSGIEILNAVRQRGLPVKIVLLTSNIDDDRLLEVIRKKVDGLVLKETAASLLVTCVRSVSAGSQWIDRDAMSRALQCLTSTSPQQPGAKLTQREIEVARYVGAGFRNKQIAGEANISEGTVKMHLHKIYEKLGIGSRTELVIYMRNSGLS
jgi:two-component system nitrate/nitrite response regulator NarL